MSKLNELNIFSNQFFSPVVKFEWSKIKKKVQKQLYIELYILKNMNIYSLTISQGKILLCIILLGINLKTITLNDIVFDRLIKNIKPINFIKNNFNINKDIYSFNVSRAKVKTLSKKKMSKNWKR